MNKYRAIKKEFDFLEKTYGFEICAKQTKGSYYFVAWTNSRVTIKVLYDETTHLPLSILVYDANSLGTVYDVEEYTEPVNVEGDPKTKIKYASFWLQKAILEQKIKI